MTDGERASTVPTWAGSAAARPQVYGSTTHDDLVAMIEREAAELGLKAVVRQSDSEAELLDWIHRPPTPASRWCSTPVR